MKDEVVEVYSDDSNTVVMRHPSRRFPGVLIQGDTLHSLLSDLSSVLVEKEKLSEDAAGDLEGVYDRLQKLLENYKRVLSSHKLPLPF